MNRISIADPIHFQNIVTMEILLRFLIGGIVVSIFAVISDMLRPRSFSGLFGAAPTVALATLGITYALKGSSYAATEGRSMLAGAVALCVYSLLTSYLLLKRNWSSLPAALLAFVGWFAVSFGLWAIFLR